MFIEYNPTDTYYVEDDIMHNYLYRIPNFYPSKSYLENSIALYWNSGITFTYQNNVNNTRSSLKFEISTALYLL